MSVEILGGVVFVLSLLSLLVRKELVVVIAASLTMYGAAAAFWLGGINVRADLAFLPVLVIRAIFDDGTVKSRNGGSPAVTYLLLFLFASFFVTLFSPSIFQGDIGIIWAFGDESPWSNVEIPLKPHSGNLTQSAYAFASAVCFFSVYRIFKREGMENVVIRMAVVVAWLNIFWSVMDLVTFYTGTSEFLSFIRNGGYTLHDTATIEGIKRVNGSFPEASAYAKYSLSIFAMLLTLLSRGIGGLKVKIPCYITFVFLIWSLSTTAYVGLFLYIVYLLSKSIYMGRISAKYLQGAVVFILFFMSVGAYYFLNGGIAVLDSLVFNKLDSVSAVERGEWNRVAWNAFVGSYGIGIGVGSTRASSFLLVLLSNVGVVGTFLYLMFLKKALFVSEEVFSNQKQAAVYTACQSGAVACLISACLSSAVFDIGFFFYILLGATCGLSVKGQQGALAIALPLLNQQEPAIVLKAPESA